MNFRQLANEVGVIRALAAHGQGQELAEPYAAFEQALMYAGRRFPTADYDDQQVLSTEVPGEVEVAWRPMHHVYVKLMASRRHID